MRYAEPIVTRKREHDAWKVEILHEGRSISGLWIVDRDMRIGAASVRIAGIAGVGTANEHRKKGLALRVLRRSLEFMDEEGYDASFLYGIRDFYHRVGFATCFPEHNIVVDTRSAETASSRLRTRRMKPEDLAQVRSLYERQNRERTGAAARGRSWKGFPMGSGFGVPQGGTVVYKPGARQRVLGYVNYDSVEDRCRAAEIGGEGDEVLGAILRFLAQRAVDLRRETLSASCPADHPFAVYCRHFGCTDKTEYPSNAGPMGRSLDLHRFVTAMLPEWERLWPEDAPARLALRVGDDAVTLLRRKGVLSVRRGAKGRGLQVENAATLMQLSMGYRNADDGIGADELVGGKAEATIARALFPLRVGHMWWPDRF